MAQVILLYVRQVLSKKSDIDGEESIRNYNKADETTEGQKHLEV